MDEFDGFDEIVGQEDEELSGEYTYVDEMGNEIPAHLVGFSFKKLARKAGKAAKKVTKAAVRSPLINPIQTIRKTAQFIAKNPATALFPPAASFVLLRDAMKRKPKPAPAQPVYQWKEEQAIATAAQAKIDLLKESAQQGNPVAQQAFTNLTLANEVQKAGVAPAQYVRDYPADDVPFEQYVDPGYEDPSYEEDGTMSYDQSADGPYDAVSGLFSKLKKLGPMLDFTRKDSPIRSAVAAIPGIGSGVIAAGDMMAKARSGAKDALAKIDQVKKLAAGGNPTAQQALANLHTANALDKATEAGATAGMRIFKRLDWFPGINLYRDGVRKGIV